MKKIEGGTLWGHEKISQNKFFNEIFEQCHSAEKCKRGTLCNFLTSIVLQNIETNEGGPFGAIQKVSKSLSAEKSGTMGDPYCVFEVLDVFCFFFSFWTRF